MGTFNGSSNMRHGQQVTDTGFLFRKHTVALGGLWCLCAAYYKIEPYELEMPAFPSQEESWILLHSIITDSVFQSTTDLQLSLLLNNYSKI